MMVVTSDRIYGHKVVKTLGLVRGNTIRARHLGRDILAVLRNLVGGEVHDYTKMMAEAREQAIDRMVEEARSLNADAVVSVKFSTSYMMQNASEILVYGTAVRLQEDHATTAKEERS